MKAKAEAQLVTDSKALLISLVVDSAGRSLLSFLGRESWQIREPTHSLMEQLSDPRADT